MSRGPIKPGDPGYVPPAATSLDEEATKPGRRMDTRADTVIMPEADDDDVTIAIDEDGLGEDEVEIGVESSDLIPLPTLGGDENQNDDENSFGNTTLALNEEDMEVEEDVADRIPTIPPTENTLVATEVNVGAEMIEGAAVGAAAAAMPRKMPPPAPLEKSWCEDVFQEHYLRTLPFLTPDATLREAKFVSESLNLQTGSRVLDVACGYGRHSMELASQGVDMVALDSSLPLLQRGAEEAERRNLAINFVHGDIRELDSNGKFDGAFCLFNSFGFFDDETNKRTVRRIARALKPGGRFVLDVLNRDYVIEELPTRVWWEGDGCVVLEEVEFNYFSSRIESNRSLVFDDGNQLEQQISIRSFGLHEIGKLLHAAGLRVLEVSGNIATKGRFFGVHSRDLLITAEKGHDPTP